jgi:hypothetical protein
MRHIELIELHDHPRFPAPLRDLMTDALQALWRFGNCYGAILGELHGGLAADRAFGKGGLVAGSECGAGRAEVLDLCSGGGGPWPRLAQELEREYGLAVRVCLTDKYPNLEGFTAAFTEAFAEASTGAFAQTRRRSGDGGAAGAVRLEFVAQPVDAMRVPQELAGFRTIFSSFHHFRPAEACAVLRGAMLARRGIGVFELARREAKTVLILCCTPLLVLLLTPAMRPFRWTRMFWTYVVPVVPLVIWVDGLVSCLRAYAPEELEEMVAQMGSEPDAAGYRWRLGEERRGLLPVTYLIGYPERVAD